MYWGKYIKYLDDFSYSENLDKQKKFLNKICRNKRIKINKNKNKRKK